MPALSNKKKIMTGFACFFLSSALAQAARLHLNDSRSLNITNASHLDIPPNVQVESPAFSNETVIYLKPEAEINLDLYFQETIEFFWNGFLLTLPNVNSQWLFVNGLCDQTKDIRVFPKPHNGYLVTPDQRCTKTSTLANLVLTVISITYPSPVAGKPDTWPESSSASDEPELFLNPSAFRTEATAQTGPALTDSADFQALFDLPPQLQKIRQWPPFETSAYRRIMVSIVNFPISRQLLKHVPGGAAMNQVVENAVSEAALFTLIIEIMTQRGYIKKKVSIEQELEQFLQQVRNQDGLVNVQLVINYMKTLISRERPDIDKPNRSEALMQIIMAITGTQMLENAASEEALFALIIRTMTEMRHITKSIHYSRGLAQFQEMVRDHPGDPVNIQLVLNYMELILNRYRPDIDKKNISQELMVIITVMAENQASSKHNGKKKKQAQEASATEAQGATTAGATPVVTHSFPASAIPSRQLELVMQLVSESSANQVIGFIYWQFPQLQNVMRYAEAKILIKNEDGSINIQKVIELLNQAGDWEGRLQEALKSKPPKRFKKPSSYSS